jgi:hypothetical protein
MARITFKPTRGSPYSRLDTIVLTKRGAGGDLLGSARHTTTD